MHKWIALITSLPTENATVRMRVWRALKSSGAAALRDGVYLMPDHAKCRSSLEAISTDITASGGKALLVGLMPTQSTNFESLFNRNAEYAALLADMGAARADLTLERVPEVLRQTRKLGKALASTCDIDFFPGEARRQAEAAWRELQACANQLLSPGEPHAVAGGIEPRAVDDFKGKTWATRQRPWVDRLACAWLIRRFIDPKARFVWLASPADCPPGAVGFDFDGASFTHVGARVSFEVLVASFGLESPALLRLGALVHYLDIGGVQPGDATGVESVMAGLRASITKDDQLIAAASAVFDGLFAHYEQGGAAGQEAPSR